LSFLPLFGLFTLTPPALSVSYAAHVPVLFLGVFCPCFFDLRDSSFFKSKFGPNSDLGFHQNITAIFMLGCVVKNGISSVTLNDRPESRGRFFLNVRI
jgi:hypothetical protein